MHTELGDLSSEESRAYLRDRFGDCITDDFAEGLVALTRGFPLHLGMAGDIVAERLAASREPLTFQAFQDTMWERLPRDLKQKLEDRLPQASRDLLELRGNPMQVNELLTAILFHRLMREVDEKDQDLIRRACVPRSVTQDVLPVLWGDDGEVAGSRELLDRLLKYSFVDAAAEQTKEGRWVIHSRVRELVLTSISDWDGLRGLHRKLAEYYQHAAGAEQDPDRQFALELEAVYHALRADTGSGIELFREVAETRLQREDWRRLERVVDAALDVIPEDDSARLWARYYGLRISSEYMGVSHHDKVQRLVELQDRAHGDRKLLAYVLCAIANSLSVKYFPDDLGGPERAISVAQQSLALADELDDHTALNYKHMSDAYFRTGNMEEALRCLDRIDEYHRHCGNAYGLANVARFRARIALLSGDWRGMLQATTAGIGLIADHAEWAKLRRVLTRSHGDALLRLGFYASAERALTSEDANWREGPLMPSERKGVALGSVLMMQEKIAEGLAILREAAKHDGFISGLGAGFAMSQAELGAGLVLAGHHGEAQAILMEHVSRVPANSNGLQRALYWLGRAFEGTQSLHRAADEYRKAIECDVSNAYYITGSLIGLVRVNHALGEVGQIHESLAEAEQLSLQYEYNDHLASMRLSQGHIAWEGAIPDWGIGFDAALGWYKLALIHALRYNRFMLDEILWGRELGTPLRSIIPHCLERGEEGLRMLSTLRDWWATGINDIGTPRPDSISPIAEMEGRPLTECEAAARRIEPGDGSTQTPVLERLDEAVRR